MPITPKFADSRVCFFSSLVFYEQTWFPEIVYHLAPYIRLRLTKSTLLPIESAERYEGFQFLEHCSSLMGVATCIRFTTILSLH